MRRIVLNLAMSLDGYISDEDGGFKWIVGHGNSKQDTGDFSFEKFLETVDTIVMGSKAYEDCILTGLSDFQDKKIYVATTRVFEDKENVEFINNDIVGVIDALKRSEGKDIYIFGGADIADCFIKENAIDYYIIGIVPTILGNGRRLFKGSHSKIDLHLETTSITDGIIINEYRIR